MPQRVWNPRPSKATAICRAKKLRAEGLIVELAMQDTVEDARAYARQRGIAKLVIINDEAATEIISG